MSFPARLAACTATLLVVLPGCRVTPAQGPEVTLPVSWRNAAGFPTASPDRDLSTWWSSFGDPQMTRLIREALAGNRDLASAIARVRQAQAQRDAQRASLFPSVDYDGSRSSGKTWNDGSADRSSTSYSAGLSASWEADFFGKNRQAVLAASAEVETAKENLYSAQSSLASEVALAYLDLRSAEERLAIVKRSLTTREETTQLASWRAQAGEIDQLELRQAESSLETARSQISSQEQNIAQTRNRLALLCGRAPGGVSTGSGDIPSPARRLAVGIPADTIRQRPDVRAAGYQWVAAVARTKVAEAERLPSLRLSGSLGIDSLTSDKLFSPASTATGLVAGLSGPIFDAGRIRANIVAQGAVEEQALLSYESSVLTALSEVEDALIACRRTGERLTTLQKAAASAKQASTLASQKYRAGVIDITTVLDTQRSDLALEETVAAVKADRAAAHIQLYKALGGGWSAGS
ncbi:efflux transporter outer membrane subunit [Luteolibacter arcticus]|uniref:Efflux transporter outer membrane subunit n=1 Tax=Luteolibacter arcticus TaxID=1581411 RepID=A0ABT3GDY7_9BACT|nr:efflux transporter outer membrane subunit [Luteolibacter arcticus]MCW1921832.1 efflux transporter outer membrane subunit [Luteolibacter arcticus]